MRNLKIFFMKEFSEQIKKYKVFIIGFVMIFLGIIGPIILKLLPIIMDGGNLPIPEITTLDSYREFLENVSQMFLIIIIIMFGGSIVNEFKNQTAIIMFSKGLSRKDFILAKFFSNVLTVSIAYFASAIITHILIIILFDNSAQNVFLFFLLGWIFLIVIVALIVFVSMFTKKSVAVMGIVAGTMILMAIISILPHVGEYLPTYLATKPIGVLNNSATFIDMLPAVLISIAIIIASIISSCFLVKRIEL